MAKNFHNTNETENSESDLSQIAQVAFSDHNDPFHIYEENGEIISVVFNLPSLLQQLELAPLDVFCFHCYRMNSIDVEENLFVPRGDIPLWIEYSIGDSYLADKIFSTVKKTVGYYDAL